MIWQICVNPMQPINVFFILHPSILIASSLTFDQITTKLAVLYKVTRCQLWRVLVLLLQVYRGAVSIFTTGDNRECLGQVTGSVGLSTIATLSYIFLAVVTLSWFSPDTQCTDVAHCDKLHSGSLRNEDKYHGLRTLLQSHQLIHTIWCQYFIALLSCSPWARDGKTDHIF